MTNKIQLCKTICYSIFSLTAQHVSSDVIAHHQELLNCNYSFWFYSLRLSLPAAVIAEPLQRPATTNAPAALSPVTPKRLGGTQSMSGRLVPRLPACSTVTAD